MEQSDIDLLYTVPPYHLQTLAKLRRPKGQSGNIPLLSPSTTIPEIAAAERIAVTLPYT